MDRKNYISPRFAIIELGELMQNHIGQSSMENEDLSSRLYRRNGIMYFEEFDEEEED